MDIALAILALLIVGLCAALPDRRGGVWELPPPTTPRPDPVIYGKEVY